MTKDQNFYLFWAQSRPQIEVRILHTSKGTFIVHVKQYWCEISETF